MVRFGLCCVFSREPIRFRTVTAAALRPLPRKRQLRKLSEIALHNADSLLAAVAAVRRLGIGAFRISSQFLPRYTHPEVGYCIDDLPDADAVAKTLARVNRFRRSHDIRLSFHPDQFVVLSSPNEDVVKRSVAEIEYQAGLAQMVGAGVINLHAGGAYGDKKGSLERFARNFDRLSDAARKRCTLENDDVTYAPADLLPLCGRLRIPFVYDVHHHRCNPDGLSESEATVECVRSWFRRKQEPYFHISSPKSGWRSANARPHADYIAPSDVPEAWRGLDSFTLDVEAKAKEPAVLKLMAQWPFLAGP